jgi:hypothetical protein
MAGIQYPDNPLVKRGSDWQEAGGRTVIGMIIPNLWLNNMDAKTVGSGCLCLKVVAY